MSPLVQALCSVVSLLIILTQGGAYPTYSRSEIGGDMVTEETIFPDDYRADVQPDIDGNTNVVAYVDVAAISHISEKEKICVAKANLTLVWNDTRLRVYGEDTSVEIENIQKLWLPHLKIRNLVRKPHNAQPLDRADMSEFNTRAVVSPAGRVTLERNIDAKLNFKLKLEDYPNDEQMCDLEFSVHEHASRAVRLRVVISRKKVSDIAAPATFHIYRYKLATGNNHTVVIGMKRVMSHQHMQVYLPCYLIVILSWIPVYTPYHRANRIKLSFTAVLTMMTFAAGYRSTLPKTKHIKLIDIYFLVCIITVWVSLFSTLLVTWCTRHTECWCLIFKCKKENEEKDQVQVDEKPRKSRADDDDDSSGSINDHGMAPGTNMNGCLTWFKEIFCCCGLGLKLLRRLSAFAPVLFIVFAICYHNGVVIEFFHAASTGRSINQV